MPSSRRAAPFAVTAILLATSLTACATPADRVEAHSAAAESTLSAETTRQLDEHIDAIARLYGTAGASVAILSGDQLIYTHHYGYRNIEAGLAPDGDTAYAIWSMSKLFFDVEMMRAIEAGQVDPDVTLGEVIEGLPDAWQAITFHQAWSHISGLPDFVVDDIPADAATAYQIATGQEMAFTPGDSSQYNQTNFLLLARYLEAATGTPYRELMTTNQIERLDLGHTSFSLDHAGAEQSLTYRSSGEEPPALMAVDPPVWPEYLYTSSGLQASLNDMVRWTQALVRGELVSRDALQTAWTPRFHNDGSLADHADGWEIELRGDITAVGHEGAGRVNLRHYFRNEDPSENLTVIYLDNGGLQEFKNTEFSARLAGMVWPEVITGEERLLGELAVATEHGDPANAINAFRAHAAQTDDPSGRREDELNTIGYATLRLHGPESAIPVFGLQTYLFPDSWNAHDSLGEAYLGAGRLEDALQHYRRALELRGSSNRITRTIAEIEAEL